jgi:hypothetical protein
MIILIFGRLILTFGNRARVSYVAHARVHARTRLPARSHVAIAVPRGFGTRFASAQRYSVCYLTWHSLCYCCFLAFLRKDGCRGSPPKGVVCLLLISTPRKVFTKTLAVFSMLRRMFSVARRFSKQGRVSSAVGGV